MPPRWVLQTLGTFFSSTAQHDDQPFAQQVAQEDQGNSKDIAQGDIGDSAFPVTHLKELECLTGKG